MYSIVVWNMRVYFIPFHSIPFIDQSKQVPVIGFNHGHGIYCEKFTYYKRIDVCLQLVLFFDLANRQTLHYYRVNGVTVFVICSPSPPSPRNGINIYQDAIFLNSDTKTYLPLFDIKHPKKTHMALFFVLFCSRMFCSRLWWRDFFPSS